MAKKAAAASTEKTKPSRRTLRKKGRDKRKEKMKTDVEYKKKVFEGKSKRANDKKAAFRKKKKGK
jgi:hypothetical protein